MLEIKEAWASLPGRELYRDVSFEVEGGECLTVLGRSGSGKSTLLSFLSGTAAPGVETGGQVILNGQPIGDLRPEKRRVGIVFQDAALFPHMTALRNLLFAMPSGGKKPERAAWALQALGSVGAEHLAGVYPEQMSGGERARVALVRTLIAEPRAVLLDEPFSALDRDLRGEVRELTLGLVRERSLPCLLVTHDEEDAEAAGGKVLRLS
ncbi:ATP-binding cassette domain-containing protein [Parvularcula maris]|uniref:ATP-binding cassette domain-containing protein n=1 Tax=Parvularcula maris TaxID=2965077 RepID=A0A9X2L7X0_9PROT|nr:ATP-binding cassette domain-containing protein [Parvularcula maris]MCQ8184729.1 ATP-binding cassette domain-containing protein [Parvularcula maris]